jgi:hypothetical protein
MVRKILSDLISGVRDGIAWALFLGVMVPSPRRRRVWSELPHVGRGRASSPPWSDVLRRAEKKRAELAARGRYGRFLDLSPTESERWPHDEALRAEYEAIAEQIANAFTTAITIIAADGIELAIVQPSTQVLERNAQDLDRDADSNRPAARGGN